MKKWIAAAVAAIVLAGGFYFGSAYFAANNLREIAASGDADRIDMAVDFPSVRESLKSQMTVALTREMQNDPEMADNPFAGLGMMIMPAIVDRAIDAYVTSDGFAALVEGRKPNEPNASPNRPSVGGDMDYETEWLGMDRFRVRMSSPQTGEQGPSLLFERRGFATWKLIKVELPDSMFRRP